MSLTDTRPQSFSQTFFQLKISGAVDMKCHFLKWNSLSNFESPHPCEMLHCQSSWWILKSGWCQPLLLRPKLLTYAAAVYNWLSDRGGQVEARLYLCVRSAQQLASPHLDVKRAVATNSSTMCCITALAISADWRSRIIQREIDRRHPQQKLALFFKGFLPWEYFLLRLGG